MEIIDSHFPSLYKSIIKASPPKSHWSTFIFTTRILKGANLGIYDHFASPAARNLRLTSSSSCTHLMQNEFTKLLSERVTDGAGVDGAGVCFGQAFDRVTTDSSTADSSTNLTVHLKGQHTLSSPTRIACKYLVGCDGSHSLVRNASLGSPFIGTPSLQTLINIHFTIPPASPLTHAILNSLDSSPAMLYFVYNHAVIAAIVAHDIERGEYVAQVPFFEPFQEPKDFTEKRCRELVMEAITSEVSDATTEDITIKSVKPWRMSSMISSEYSNSEHNIFVAGDAAHVFPPAGGFGMNTGLQDVHGLAWRIARDHHARDGTELQSYSLERKGVAEDNAALSMRNYERTLDVARMIGLDANHPQFVIGGLEALRFVPKEAKKKVFQTLVDTAMLPLRVLEVGGPVVTLVQEKIQRLLDDGLGLPLLFPKYELGFIYGERMKKDGGDDMALYEPVIRVGARVPDVLVRVGGEPEPIRTGALCAQGFEDVVLVQWGSPLPTNIDGKVIEVELEGEGAKLMREYEAIVVRPDGHIRKVIRL